MPGAYLPSHSPSAPSATASSSPHEASPRSADSSAGQTTHLVENEVQELGERHAAEIGMEVVRFRESSSFSDDGLSEEAAPVAPGTHTP